ncbi:MAG: UvrD/REP helicase [Pseudomonadota bacterium]
MRALTPALACDPRRSVVVEACAGSGKTWLLTARIARALLEGCTPGAVLALTFTNKAAEEMQSRVWEALEALSGFSPQEARARCLEWGVPEDRLEACVEQAPRVFERLLLSPERPFVGTFHAWYLRLLASAPIGFARLSRLTPSQKPSALRRMAFRRWSQQLSASEASAFAWLVRELGTKRVLEALWQAVSWQRQVEVHSPGQWLRLAPGLDWEQALRDNSAAQQAWVRSAQPIAATLARAFGELDDKRHELANTLLDFSLAPPESVSLDHLERALLTDDKTAPVGRRQLRLKKTLIRKADAATWGSRASHFTDLLHQLEEGYAALRQQQAQRCQQARQEVLMTLSSGLLRAMDALAAASDESDFDGIEAAALDLVQSPQGASLLARWDCRTEQILVDEFQDTSPSQWALLRAWLEAHAGQSLPEAHAPKVFLVGDPKQSIYQFRGGDPRVFEAARRWLYTRYGAELLTADATRRCGGAVVGLLNAVMPDLMNGPQAIERYRPHTSLAPPVSGGVFHLPLVLKSEAERAQPLSSLDRDWLNEPRSAASSSLHLEEGRRIAAFLKAMHEADGSLPWSEMRVLVRARTHLAHIEQAFAECGIPYVSDRSGGLLEQPVVQDLLALCRLMAYPYSDQDCCHVLCSPLVGLHPASLPAALGVARERGLSLLELLSSPSAVDALGGSWTQAAGQLAGWRPLAAALPIHDFLSHVVAESALVDALELGLPVVQAAQAKANVRAFLHLSLQWEGGRLPSLSRFVHDLADRAQGERDEQPAVGIPDQQWDAVTLQSLHAAKGLEAQLVVLASAAANDRNDTSLRWLVEWSEGRDRIEALDAWLTRDVLSDAQMARLDLQIKESEAESANLLYVAITRAKRYFAVSGVEGGGSWYARVSQHTQAWEEVSGDPSAG